MKGAKNLTSGTALLRMDDEQRALHFEEIAAMDPSERPVVTPTIAEILLDFMCKVALRARDLGED